jgi:hypothetical protein
MITNILKKYTASEDGGSMALQSTGTTAWYYIPEEHSFHILL